MPLQQSALGPAVAISDTYSHFKNGNTRESTIPARPDDDEGARRQQERFKIDTVFQFLTADALAFRGYDTSFLKEDQPHFTATGAPLVETAGLKAKRREIHQLDKYSLSRLNTSAWSVLKAAFDMTNIDKDDLAQHFTAPHAFQFILVTTANRALNDKSAIADDFLALNSRSTPNVAALLQLISDTKALTLLHRIIHGEDPFFAKLASLLPKVLYCLQHSANINSLPACIQTEFHKAIKFFLDRVKKTDSVLASAVLARLSPILLSGNCTRDSAD
jgi:hypothetical protein